MSIYEYDAEAHIRMEREDSYADGLEAGKTIGMEAGKALGVEMLIESCQELSGSPEYAVQKLCQKYKLSEVEAKKYVKKHWK